MKKDAVNLSKMVLNPNDVEQIAFCDFGLSSNMKGTMPVGGTPTVYNPLSQDVVFQVSQDRSSLGTLALKLDWGREYNFLSPSS